ncbi:hypothetical protein [Streptomyces sp. 7N604]|uniref:hypothetical protein n=1 Tax=Streptomyces sp. 7N604 TaxID=3457415 RepID=UPI003FCFFCF5
MTLTSLRASIDTSLAAHARVGAAATWMLCSHDMTCTSTCFGRDGTGFDSATEAHGVPTDPALGIRRARPASSRTRGLVRVAELAGEPAELPGTSVLLEVERLPQDMAAWPRTRRRTPGRRLACAVARPGPLAGSAIRHRGRQAPRCRLTSVEAGAAVNDGTRIGQDC